jgi:hypothetical protein
MKTRQCILVVWIRCTAIWVEENITTPPAASKDSSAKGGEEEEEEEASFSDAVGGGGGGGTAETQGRGSVDGQVRMTRRLCTEASETSIETEGGAQVWAREIRQACPEKESPRKGNS